MLSYEDMISDIKSNEDLLTSWEIDFIESIDNIRTIELSQAQLDKIIQIYEKVT